ncbi:hypothetical protein CBS101457_001308 [Exobasidium rhododendri]|nr:hypothetical protein CBS101457_001308 [Exobasidium rhododendri]
MSMIVLPGDRVSIPSSSNVKLGPGLATPSSEEAETQAQHEFIVTLPGFVGQVASDKGKGKASNQMQVDEKDSSKQQREQVACWVESNSKRYIPALHDQIICQITNRGTESYQVTLFNSYTSATLSGFAFEGATKRNKPNLKVGTLLYAQVLSASRHLEVELTCVDQNTGKSNGYGELKIEEEQEGKTVGNIAMLWSVSCGLAKSLLKPAHPLLARLASHFPFEVAVGVNGYVWVRAGQAKHVIAVGKVLEQADKVKGSNTGANSESYPGALDVMRNRGMLSAEEISKIVEPFIR